MSEQADEVPLSDLDSRDHLPAELRACMVPQQILGDTAYSIVEELDLADVGEVAVFATIGSFLRLGIVLATGDVVQLNRDGRRVAASSSVDEFACVARSLREWYRGLSIPPSQDVGSIRRQLAAVAPDSIRDGNGFWRTVLDDIEIGDFDD